MMMWGHLMWWYSGGGFGMCEWKETTLSDICSDISYGYTASANVDTVGPKFLRITDIVPDRINWNTVPYCEADELNIEKYKLQEGDIVIARTGATTGYNKIIKNIGFDVVFASYLIRYKIDVNMAYPYYIGHILQSSNWYNYVDAIAGGSAQPGANAKQLGSFEILLPPLPEQRAIASVLSSLDDKIDLLHRQNKTLEAMAKTLFRKWFVEEADEGWEWVELSQFIEVMRGLSYKGAGLAEKGNGVPMHNLNSIYEGGGYKYEGIKYYSGDYKDRHLVKPGDVIITNTEQGHDLLLIGYPAIVPKYFGDLEIFSQHIYRLRLKDKRITEPFLYYLLMSYAVREQLAGATNGSTVNMLPKDGIEWAKFKNPPDDKIKKFTSIVKPLFCKKESNYSQIRTLEQQRDTLLPKLISGEMRVEV